MSDDLVERKLELLRQAARVSPILKDALAVVADCIEELTAERDTLAEMVRAVRIKVRPTASGPWLSCESPDITPDQAERFASVLVRIAKETGDE